MTTSCVHGLAERHGRQYRAIHLASQPAGCLNGYGFIDSEPINHRFAGEDWWYHHPHSKNHIMRRLARAGNRVLFVNSISMGLPALQSPDLAAKIKRKLRSYAKAVRRTEEGIIVVSPPVLPFYTSRIGRTVNRWLLVAQLKLLMVAFDLRDPVLWIAIPTAREVVGHLGSAH